MLHKRYLTLIVSLLIAILIVAGCSPGSEADEPASVAETSHEEVADHDDDHGHAQEDDGHGHDEEEGHEHGLSESIHDAKEIRVVAKEWGFEPATIHLHEGEAVNIVLVNEGVVEHELQAEGFDFHVHAQPGETVVGGFVPDSTGTFEFGCLIPGHYEAGMVGEIEVSKAH